MSDLLEIAEDWVREVWQRGNMDYAASMCAENYADYSVPEHPDGDCAALQEHVQQVRAAFPDLKAEVEDSFQDQDFVILRILFTGTHQHDFEGFVPTLQEVEWESIEILHFRDELLIEHFSQNDLLAALEDAEIETDELEEGAEQVPEMEEVERGFGELQRETEAAALIDRLADSPRRVREAIRAGGVHPRQSGEWSTQATVAHLWRGERQVWQARLQQLANDESPYWEWWDPQRFDWEAEFGTSDINVLLDAFEFLRGETCRYLREMPDSVWTRRGTHAVYGELDVAGLMQKAFDHDQEHLAALSGAQV